MNTAQQKMDTPITNMRLDTPVRVLLLKCVKQLEAAVGLNASETYREVIQCIEDVDILSLAHRCAGNEFDLNKLNLRSKPGRRTQECVQNAHKEYKQTKNKMRWGYLTNQFDGRQVHCVLHAFNEDKDGTFYDTQNFPAHGDFRGVVSVAPMEFKDGDWDTLYDYYYIKTKGRTFRFRNAWVNREDEYELECEILDTKDDGIYGVKSW